MPASNPGSARRGSVREGAYPVNVSSVEAQLPAKHATALRASLAGPAEMRVDDLGEHRIRLVPREGSGMVRSYLNALRIADARTDLDAEQTWAFLATHTPFVPTPSHRIVTELGRHQDRLRAARDLPGIAERLGVAVSLADASLLPGIFRVELPHLFTRYPEGSLWCVVADSVLARRLAFMRIMLRLELAPDLPVGRDLDVAPFGAHQLTGGISFSDVITPALLAFMPVAAGFTMPAMPHTFVFLFGEFEDLRTRSPGPFARRFFPSVHSYSGVPGIKLPTEHLTTANVESLLGWWTSRLNIAYSHAADPTMHAAGGKYDAGAQAAWLFTFERMLADAASLASSVDTSGLLRIQIAFDLLDKASALMAPRRGQAHQFRRLLNRQESLPRLERVFGQMPVQLRTRFRTWAVDAFDRFYADVEQTIVAERITRTGVLVGHTGPSDLREIPWEQYVPELVREARNASHGLQELFAQRQRADRPLRRALVAISSGTLPVSFLEVTWLLFWGLMAEPDVLWGGGIHARGLV